MRDPRLDKLANVLVHYSTQIQPGQLVRISGEPVATPAIEAVYETVLKAGAHPIVRCAPESLQELFFKHASDEQLKYVSPIAKYEIETVDVTIGFWAETNTKGLSRIDPARQGMASAARKPLFDVFMNRAASGALKWTGTLYPTAASAQDAEMSLADYEEFVLNAGLLHLDDPIAGWQQVEKQQAAAKDYLENVSELRFQAANGTDLRVNVEGMKWINCCGRENFPDGEVFTGPNLNAADGGVNGTVRYSFPAVHGGREVHEVELTFEKGKVVDFKAGKGEDFLKAMLDQDEGARYMGEIAIGTNYNITEYTKNTLFDEKIGGTFHAAVGSGYPETGNHNSSGLHWDMVCDIRPDAGGGEITADGETIMKDGRFIKDGWPGPA
jgi:aminopeptidase